jgi:hypothetical protein
MREHLNGWPCHTGTCDPGERYEIRVAGHLGSHWSEWFEGLAITHPTDGETLLSGPVVDQAALHGLLAKVRDLNVPLISVRRIEPGAGGEDDVVP